MPVNPHRSAVALALVALTACQPPAPAYRAHAAVADVPAARTTGDPFEGAVEFDLGPPGTPRPLLVAVHGRGDRPERFASLFRTLGVPVHVRSLRATNPYGDGYAWFGTGGADWNDRYADAVARVVAGLAPRAGEHYCGRPVLVGFSQGAMLAYGVAAAAPTATAAVFPLAGELPIAFRAGVRAPRPGDTFGLVRGEHGDADAVIPYAHGQDAVGFLRSNGYDATLETEAGQGHTVGDDARAWLMRELERVLRGQC